MSACQGDTGLASYAGPQFRHRRSCGTAVWPNSSTQMSILSKRVLAGPAAQTPNVSPSKQALAKIDWPIVRRRARHRIFDRLAAARKEQDRRHNCLSRLRNVRR